MKRVIMLLAILAVAVTSLVITPAPAYACSDGVGFQECQALNACDAYETIRVRLECARRCHRLYCV